MTWLSPPQFARILHSTPERVICLIHDGKLPAINIATPGSKRPRYRIDPADIAVLKKRLAVVPERPAGRRRITRPRLDPALPTRYL